MVPMLHQRSNSPGLSASATWGENIALWLRKENIGATTKPMEVSQAMNVPKSSSSRNSTASTSSSSTPMKTR